MLLAPCAARPLGGDAIRVHRRAWIALGQSVLDATSRLRSEITKSPSRASNESTATSSCSILDVSITAPASFAIRVRVPEWAGEAEFAVNGEPAERVERPGLPRSNGSGATATGSRSAFPIASVRCEGHRLGEHVLHADEAAVFLGPRVFCLSDLHNPAVEQHFVRLNLVLTAITESRLPGRIDSKRVVTHLSGEVQPLTMTPITETGGNPNGIGRSHSGLASPFRVWFPVKEPGDVIDALFGLRTEVTICRPNSAFRGLTSFGGCSQRLERRQAYLNRNRQSLSARATTESIRLPDHLIRGYGNEPGQSSQVPIERKYDDAVTKDSSLYTFNRRNALKAAGGGAIALGGASRPCERAALRTPKSRFGTRTIGRKRKMPTTTA